MKKNINCPKCNNPIEIVSLRQIRCKSCGATLRIKTKIKGYVLIFVIMFLIDRIFVTVPFNSFSEELISAFIFCIIIIILCQKFDKFITSYLLRKNFFEIVEK